MRFCIHQQMFLDHVQAFTCCVRLDSSVLLIVFDGQAEERQAPGVSHYYKSYNRKSAAFNLSVFANGQRVAD